MGRGFEPLWSHQIILNEVKMNNKLCETKKGAESEWRRLALQFDEHRMQAIGHLKCLLQDPQGHRESAEKFLTSSPLSGEIVLEERLKDIAERRASSN
ncbi:hypothetical protein GW796_08435 [archaeon]|nr:hypothetical protein [archaeon]